QFLNCQVVVWSKQLFNSVFTSQDASFSSCFDVLSCPVVNTVVLVFVSSYARNRIQIDRFNDDCCQFSASDCFVKTCCSIWVSSYDTSCFQCIKLLLWSKLCIGTECYGSKHGECHCCRQSYG